MPHHTLHAESQYLEGDFSLVQTVYGVAQPILGPLQ
jgi:hypothetical protein